MKRFMVIYRAPADAMAQMGEATPEQKEEGMKAWYAWKETLGDKLIDLGNPLMMGTKVLPDGNSEMSNSDISGYSMLQANDMDEARSYLANHPHLGWNEGCAIELFECIEM